MRLVCCDIGSARLLSCLPPVLDSIILYVEVNSGNSINTNRDGNSDISTSTSTSTSTSISTSTSTKTSSSVRVTRATAYRESTVTGLKGPFISDCSSWGSVFMQQILRRARNKILVLCNGSLCSDNGSLCSDPTESLVSGSGGDNCQMNTNPDAKRGVIPSAELLRLVPQYVLLPSDKLVNDCSDDCSTPRDIESICLPQNDPRTYMAFPVFFQY